MKKYTINEVASALFRQSLVLIDVCLDAEEKGDEEEANSSKDASRCYWITAGMLLEGMIPGLEK